MSRYTVITTINPESEGMRRFQEVTDRHLVVTADRRTPAFEATDHLTYLSVDDQLAMDFQLAERLPFNHYCRKNLGYLWAMQHGAESVYDTDDDNAPYNDWGFPTFYCANHCVADGQFVNVYAYFSQEFIWPRGYPLDEIQACNGVGSERGEPLGVGVWQGLADGDPDVDAIFRLLFTRQTQFERKDPIVLEQGRYCPFNSQNTLWQPAAFAYLYLPVTVSFRFTDILRGYAAQRMLWEHGLHLGFTRATVSQRRNAHDLMHDFGDEIECYVRVKKVVEVLESLRLCEDPLKNLRDTYQALAAAGCISADELSYVSAWVKDCEGLLPRV